MGVPKFCRYICERYPCLLELVNEYEIPEFDNLYLDMNGIVHCCSHPNNMDAHFRITEEDIFKNIFQYVEILFNMIKPRKVFFMAVDGVAPRAKINQQRGRRFRAAKDADLAEAKARERGEEIPKEARFDSNCITPGTLFMARLTEQLKYFVAWKISTNELWKKCKVVLSGPESLYRCFWNVRKKMCEKKTNKKIAKSCESLNKSKQTQTKNIFTILFGVFALIIQNLWKHFCAEEK